MQTQFYGYARVSSKEQNQDRQLHALENFPVPRKNIYTDKLSGKDFNRPDYQRLIRRLRCGDVLVVLSIDRLGRNYEEILEQWRIITKKIGADVVVLDFPLLDTRARQNGSDLTGRFVADLVLQILAYTAEKERENIRRRQAEGIAAAKARGVTWGRQKLPRPAETDHYTRLWKEGSITLTQIGERLGVSRSKAYSLVTENL